MGSIDLSKKDNAITKIGTNQGVMNFTTKYLSILYWSILAKGSIGPNKTFDYLGANQAYL